MRLQAGDLFSGKISAPNRYGYTIVTCRRRRVLGRIASGPSVRSVSKKFKRYKPLSTDTCILMNNQFWGGGCYFVLFDKIATRVCPRTAQQLCIDPPGPEMPYDK